MPQNLKEVTLDEISLVDKGACQFASIVIIKRDDTVCKCGKDYTCDKCKAKKEEVEKAPSGIKFNIGFKDEGGSEVQSVVFDSSKWDVDRAKAWLKDHDMESGKVDEKANTIRFRQKDPEGYKRFRMITPGAQISKALRAKQSFNQVQGAVERALRDKFQTKGEINGYPGNYLWLRDLFKDSVVFDQDGLCYRATYEVARQSDGELQVTFGERVPVEVVYQDVVAKQEPVAPSVPDSVRLRLLNLRASSANLV